MRFIWVRRSHMKDLDFQSPSDRPVNVETRHFALFSLLPIFRAPAYHLRRRKPHPQHPFATISTDISICEAPDIATINLGFVREASIIHVSTGSNFFSGETLSPPLTLARPCSGVLLTPLSYGGRIRRQACEQHRPVGKTDFEAKEEEIPWRKLGAMVRKQLFSLLFCF